MELQSPLNFATPIVGSGPSFLRDEKERDLSGVTSLKRKSPEGENDLLVVRLEESKRVKQEGHA